MLENVLHACSIITRMTTSTRLEAPTFKTHTNRDYFYSQAIASLMCRVGSNKARGIIGSSLSIFGRLLGELGTHICVCTGRSTPPNHIVLDIALDDCSF